MENLYSGTFRRFAIAFPNILLTSPWVTSNVTHKTDQKPALERLGDTPNCLFNVTLRYTVDRFAMSPRPFMDLGHPVLQPYYSYCVQSDTSPIFSGVS